MLCTCYISCNFFVHMTRSQTQERILYWKQLIKSVFLGGEFVFVVFFESAGFSLAAIDDSSNDGSFIVCFCVVFMSHAESKARREGKSAQEVVDRYRCSGRLDCVCQNIPNKNAGLDTEVKLGNLKVVVRREKVRNQPSQKKEQLEREEQAQSEQGRKGAALCKGKREKKRCGSIEKAQLARQ